MRLYTHSFVPFTLGVVALAMLSACGGGSDPAAPPVTPTPPPPVVTVTSLTGTAAVGAPMTSGTLRVLDATGAVVAHDIAINTDGTYDAGTLTGTAPWRIEACGYTGANYGCIYSVAHAAGVANVTPLTTAMITLATGHSPDTIMTDGASAPTPTALTAAQTQLQTGLAGTLTDAGVAANFDFTTGSLAAGTRSGYDRILDAVNVTTGTDNGAFVQVTPRLGDGNLYLTTGTTTGTITAAAGASTLPLGGLETLFTKMTAAVASASACADANTGLASVVASDARLSMGGGGMQGGVNVAAGLCQYFGQGDGGSGAIWGSRFVSPTLGRCDLTGTDPLCAVSFALQGTDGSVQNVGDGTGVVYRAGRWQFFGDLLPIAIHANAAVQRGVRVDDPNTPLQYSRALQFDIARTDGVACAVLSARNDTHSTIAIYKVFSQDAQRMSLWTSDGQGNQVSTDPSIGALRGSDDTWMQLPAGVQGDDVIRTFYRAGRTIDVSIYSNAACSTPATLDSKSVFAVDIAGMPPVDSALASLPWGALTADTVTALEALTLNVGAPGSLSTAWTFSDGVTGFDQAVVCTSGSCGGGSDVRIGDMRVRPGVRTATVSLHAPSMALAAGDFKMFSLGGRDGTGMNTESSFFSCTGTPLGQMCGQGQPPIGGAAPTQGGNGSNGSGNGNGNGDTGTPPSGPTATHKRSH
ncbi:MAG: hypothetical protein M3N82_03880 [Pseudomonadota bacterium]|nr:hypothetical protein [Pseudomonadota bacterium]